MNGSLKDPQIAPGVNFNPNSNDFADQDTVCSPSSATVLSNGAVMPAVTNSTACEDGKIVGYKDVKCVGNMTIGDFPDMLVKAHEQILAGERGSK